MMEGRRDLLVSTFGREVGEIITGIRALPHDNLVLVTDTVMDGNDPVLSFLRRLVRRGPITGWDEGFARFQRASAALIRRRWAALTVATLVSHLSIFWVLLACLRDVGVGREVISWPEALGAFAIVRLATVVPITPGGLGLVEVGMTAGLVIAAGGAGGREEAKIMAAVLLFRALTYLFQVLLGIVCYFIWQREARRAGRAAAAGRPAAEAPPD